MPPIRLKRGLAANLPTLAEGEIAFTTDNKKVLVGTSSGNMVFGEGEGFSGSWLDLTNKPSSFTPAAHNHDAANINSGRLGLARLPTSATANRVLLIGATASSDPVYGQVDLTTMISGRLPVGNGGVPAVETASGKRFLRNDNTWQDVTPANIGAATTAQGAKADTALQSIPDATATIKGIMLLGAANGAAAYSHGNHVPAVQTADNKVFLRNDNSWQAVTPANIGAATAAQGAKADTALQSIPDATATVKGVMLLGAANGAAAFSHNHDAGNVTTGRLGIARLPTSTTANRVLLVGATANADPVYGQVDVTTMIIGRVPVANGGVPAVQTASNSVFLRNDNSWQTVTPANIGAAPASHNHDAGTVFNAGRVPVTYGGVPAVQTASNSVFLRNDNSWATVTPANIGAAASSHNHDAGTVFNAGRVPVTYGGVPAVQTASNSVFLRNDNSWATVTPANIGAATSAQGTLADNALSRAGGIMTGRVVGAPLVGSWISCHTTAAALYSEVASTGSSAHAFHAMRLGGGDGWAFTSLQGTGNVLNFQYATKANIDAATNTVTNVMTFSAGRVNIPLAGPITSNSTITGATLNATDKATTRNNLGVAAKPTRLSLTLSTWLGSGPYTCTVTATGIVVGNTQGFWHCPDDASYDMFVECGVRPKAATTANSLTFVATEKPSANLVVNVVLQEVA